MGSLYIGYVILHLPAAMLAERIGGKPVIVVGLLSSLLLTLLTPLIISECGPYALIFSRIIIGSFQAGMFPATSTLLSAWVPASERGILGSIVFCGFPVGFLQFSMSF